MYGLELDQTPVNSNSPCLHTKGGVSKSDKFMKVQWARVIKTTATLMKQREFEKIETLKGEYEQLVHSGEPGNLGSAEILTTKMRMSDAKCAKIDHIKSLLLPFAEQVGNFEALLNGMLSVATSNEAISSSFLCAHRRLEKLSILSRSCPKKPLKLPPTDQVQVRTIEAIENGSEPILSYLRLPDSFEGQKIRTFAEDVIEHIHDYDLSRIPVFLIEQRKSLMSRVQSFTASESSATTVPENAETALAALVNSPSCCYSDAIDCAFEDYFYHMVGDHVFSRVEESDCDKEFAVRCGKLSAVTPNQLNLPVSSIELFSNVVSLLRELASSPTPTSKLVTCYKAVKELLEVIHRQTGKRPTIEDALEPLQFCCILANPPKAFSQLRFIAAMKRRKFENTSFWHLFSVLQLVIDNILSLQIDDTVLESSGNLESVLSVNNKCFLSKRFGMERFASLDEMATYPDFTLVPDVFPEIPTGITSLSDPVVVTGFKCYVVPDWRARPGSLFSVLVVKTDCEEDSIVVRRVEFSNDVTGLRSAMSLVHPPFVDVKPVQTAFGIVHATVRSKIPTDLRVIPVVSGDVEKEEADINLKVRFMMVNSLEGYKSLAEHHRVTEDLYGESSDDSAELLDRICMRTCQSLESLGLLPAKHGKRRIDWRVLAALRNFTRRFTGEDERCDCLTPELLWKLEEYLRNWQNALQVTSFGYLVDAPRDSWRLTAGLIQVYSDESLTFKLDERTVHVAKKLVRYLLQQSIGDSTKTALSKVLNN